MVQISRENIAEHQLETCCYLGWADPDWLAKKEQLGQRSMQMEGSFDEIHPGHWADVVNG